MPTIISDPPAGGTDPGGGTGTPAEPPFDPTPLYDAIGALETRVADLEAFRASITTAPGGADLYAPSFHAAIDVNAGNNITAGNVIKGLVLWATRKFKGEWVSKSD